MMQDTIKKLILIGRPASGKSEFINFMKKISDEERKKNVSHWSLFRN